MTAHRQQYETDGWTTFESVLDPDLIAEASGHVDWLLEQNPGLRPEQLHHNLVVDDPFWLRLVSDPRLLDVAEQFIGPNIALFASHYISKPPRDGQPVLWHQDGAYWPLDPMEVVTLWLAVDASDVENGCMRVISGTQSLDLKKLQENRTIPNVLNSETPAEFVDEGAAIDILLSPGSVSVHHPNVIHGSNANTSDRRRCGLTIRYIPTSTRIASGAGCPFLLRGDAVPGVNDYLPRPKFVDGKHYPFRGSDAWR